MLSIDRTGPFVGWSINVLKIRDGRIADITSFICIEHFAARETRTTPRQDQLDRSLSHIGIEENQHATRTPPNLAAEKANGPASYFPLIELTYS